MGIWKSSGNGTDVILLPNLTAKDYRWDVHRDALLLWHVLHEGVLRHVVGSPAIVQAPLDKLAELAHQPGMVIQVLPFTVSDHPGTDGPILVYDFDGSPRWHIPSATVGSDHRVS